MSDFIKKPDVYRAAQFTGAAGLAEFLKTICTETYTLEGNFIKGDTLTFGDHKVDEGDFVVINPDGTREVMCQHVFRKQFTNAEPVATQEANKA